MECSRCALCPLLPFLHRGSSCDAHQHHRAFLLAPQVLATTLKESKQGAVRQLCCSCLLYALKHWPIEILTKVGPLMENVLVAATSDNAVEVRAVGRAGLTQYQSAFPTRANAVDLRLDSPTRKLLRQEPQTPSADRHIVVPRPRAPRPSVATPPSPSTKAALAATDAAEGGPRTVSTPPELVAPPPRRKKPQPIQAPEATDAEPASLQRPPPAAPEDGAGAATIIPTASINEGLRLLKSSPTRGRKQPLVVGSDVAALSKFELDPPAQSGEERRSSASRVEAEPRKSATEAAAVASSAAKPRPRPAPSTGATKAETAARDRPAPTSLSAQDEALLLARLETQEEALMASLKRLDGRLNNFTYNQKPVLGTSEAVEAKRPPPARGSQTQQPQPKSARQAPQPKSARQAAQPPPPQQPPVPQQRQPRPDRKPLEQPAPRAKPASEPPEPVDPPEPKPKRAGGALPAAESPESQAPTSRAAPAAKAPPRAKGAARAGQAAAPAAAEPREAVDDPAQVQRWLQAPRAEAAPALDPPPQLPPSAEVLVQQQQQYRQWEEQQLAAYRQWQEYQQWQQYQWQQYAQQPYTYGLQQWPAEQAPFAAAYPNAHADMPSSALSAPAQLQPLRGVTKPRDKPSSIRTASSQDLVAAPQQRPGSAGFAQPPLSQRRVRGSVADRFAQQENERQQAHLRQMDLRQQQQMSKFGKRDP